MAALAALAAFGRRRPCVQREESDRRGLRGRRLLQMAAFMGAVIHDMTHVDRVAGGNWMREREGALRHGHTAACLASARGGGGAVNEPFTALVL